MSNNDVRPAVERDFNLLRERLHSIMVDEEMMPLLANRSYLPPMDFVLAVVLTIILTMSILTGVYLIMEESDWPPFGPNEVVFNTKTFK